MTEDKDAKVPETRLPNGITVYGDAAMVAEFNEAIEEFPQLWTSRGGTVRVSEKDHMTVPLIANWEEKVKVGVKVYPLSEKDRAVVDKEFNRLHAEDKMK